MHPGRLVQSPGSIVIVLTAWDAKCGPVNCPRSLVKGGLCRSVHAVSIPTFCFSPRWALRDLMPTGSSCYETLDSPTPLPQIPHV